MAWPIAFQTRLSLAFLAAVSVVIALTLASWTMADGATEAATKVAHTQQVLADLAVARVGTVQIELHTQSFRTSGNPAFLAERDAVIAARETQLGRLKSLTADNALQQDLLRQLREVIDQRLAISRQVETLRREQGLEAANAYVATAPLQETRVRSYALFDRMKAEQERLLALRLGEQQLARERMLWFGALACAALLLLLAATYWLIRRKFAETEASRLALALSEERSAATLRSIGDAVIATDTARRITHMNPVAERLTGWSYDAARGRPLDEVLRLLHADTRRPAPAPVEQVLVSGERCELGPEILLQSRDGSELPIADSAAPIRDRAGKLCGAVMVFRDETLVREARHAAEAQHRLLEQRVAERTLLLEDRESHLRSIINSVPALIAFVDAEQRYGYVNERYRERFAPDASNISGRSVREVLGELRYAIARPLIERALQGESPSYDWEPFPDVWQLIQYAPKRDAGGRITGYYVLGTDISERRRMENALQDSQRQLTRVLEGSDQGYWDWDLTHDVFQVSPRFETMLGYQPGEMQVQTANWPSIVHAEDLPKALAAAARHRSGQAPSYWVEIRGKTKEGSWRWLLMRGSIVQRDAEGRPQTMSGTITDVHERKLLEIAQRASAVVFENSFEGIIVADAQGLISRVNPAFTRITGYSEAEVIGRSPKLLASGQHDAAFYREFWSTLRRDGIWHGEISNRNKAGETFVALQSVSLVRDDKGATQHYISVFTDITRIKAHASELDHVAHYDTLTGLPNRRLLADRLQLAIHRADRRTHNCAVCVLDLDDFKQINEQHGQAIGDRFLIGVAEHIKQVLRSDDTLARLGGDEFVVLLSDIGGAKEGAQVLDRILAAVSQTVQVDALRLSSTASIGVSLYPADHVDPETLLRHADSAMLQAKSSGKNRYQLFDPESDRQTQHRLEQLQRLALALEQQEFELFFQPKVDLRSGAVIGAEALIRWRHPQRGLVPPGEFLVHLQGSPLERTVGAWVIESALIQAEHWAAQGLHMPVSVNISANHLMRADFVERLTQALGRHPGVPPAMLELEVLETAAISDMQQAVDIMKRCNGLGVSFSLDDFGTGYSSLTYLRQLPAQTLKIDQSFVRNMLVDADDLSIVQGVIQLAAAFHRSVIAEGVETLEHGTALLALGCKLAQGYGISRPMPAAELPGWCERWHSEQAWLRL